MTIYSLDVLLFLFGTSLLFHVQFYLLLPDLHIGFSRGRSGGLVFPSLLEFSTVYCDPHKGFGIVNKTQIGVFLGEDNGTPLQYSCLEIPWTEEPGTLQSMGSLRVGHDWATSLSLFIFMHWRRKWQPAPVFLPGESQGRGSLVGCRVWGRTESDTTEVT